MDPLQIQKIIDDSRLTYGFSAISVSIACASEQSPQNFVSGYTMKNGGTALTLSHLFQIGSITKSFIAVLMLQLAAKNVLSLDDPIEKWLPTIPPSWRLISIRQLLNHTSGIYNYTETFDEIIKSQQFFDLNKAWSTQELIAIAFDKPLYFTPGSNWHYSNTNYAIAGLIIEKATKKPLAQVLNENIFEPYHLTHSYYLPKLDDPAFSKWLVHGYSERNYFPDEPKDITYLNLSWANAGGGIISTSEDLALWFLQLSGGKLLPAKQMQELMTLIPINNALPFATPDMSYGLGLLHDSTSLGESVWFHTGGTLGFSAYVVWLTQSQWVIAVTINHCTQNRDIYEVTKTLATYLQKISMQGQSQLKTVEF